MRTIWKFPLSLNGWQPVAHGRESKVVLVAIDPATGAPAIWIEHIPPASSDARVQRHFGVFPTGGTIATNADHVGSLIDRDLVWHIYERRPFPVECDDD